MIFFKKFVQILGVALCVAPTLFMFVGNVSAQQGSASNNQSQMLFEMQAMKQEIGELRDMVERQAYQIRQLQRNNNQQTDQQIGQQQGQQPTNNSILSNQSPAIDSSAINNESIYQQSPTTVSEYPPVGSNPAGYTDTTNNPIQQGANQYPTNVEERPINGLPNQANSGYQQPSVEERVVDNYPPVEERTIGGQAQQAPQSGPETYTRQPSNQLPTDDQGNFNQQPSSGQQASNQQTAEPIDPNFPQPYQRDQPARLPIPNNIPSRDPSGVAAVPSGPVVSIPQQSGSQQDISNTANAAPVQNDGVGEGTYYQQGFDLLKESKHDEAVTTFKKQIDDYPQGEYADDAHYWIAESLYVNRDLDQSKQYFKAIIDNFAQSSRLPDAMLKTAYIEQEQGNNIEARILLQEIIQFHPRSNAAISAKNRLADLK